MSDRSARQSTEEKTVDLPSRVHEGGTIGFNEPPTETGAPVFVPGYEVLGELGRGGMGVVYKARHLELNRLCALKMVLAGQHADGGQRQRFLAEARAVAALSHPHIVPVFEIGQHGELPYFSLEFLPGGTLTDKVRDNPMPARDAAALAEKLARAVAYAHDRGVVHRDLKPDNILIGETGEPKVTDFGLAKQTDGASNLTASGAIVGTPSYMAPEQAEGRKDVGPPADTYALGAILYRLVTGRPPFQAATTMETVHQVMRDDPVPPSRLVGRMPRDLETIILTCLRKEPARRYDSSGALADDLKRFLADEPIRARPVGPVERAWRWGRKNPLAAATAALVAIVATAAVVVPVAVAGALSTEQGRTQDALNKSLDAEKAALRQAAESTTERALQMCQRGEAAAGLHWLTRGLELAQKAGNADLEDACRWNLGAWSREVHSLERLMRHPGAVICAAFTRDGLRVATGCADGKVRFWDVATGSEVGTALVHPRGVAALAFEPGGGKLATACYDGIVRIWEPGQEKSVGEWRFQPDGAPDWLRCRIAFSPDGRRLLTGGMSPTLNVWDVATGALAMPQLNHRNRQGTAVYVEGVDWSSDGRFLLAANGTWEATVFDARTGGRFGNPISLPGRATTAAFAPDGKTFATGYMLDGSVQLWDTATGALRARLPHQAYVNGLDFSSDGKILATCSENGDAILWDTQSFQPLGVRLFHPDSTQGIAMSPDSRMLATACADGNLRLWLVAPRAERLRIPRPAQVRSLTFTPDSQELVVGLHGDQAEREEGRVIHRFDRRTGKRSAVAYDGRPDTNGLVWGGMTYSPDHTNLYITTHGETRRWDARTGERGPRLFDHSDNWTSGIQLSRDGNLFAIGTPSGPYLVDPHQQLAPRKLADDASTYGVAIDATASRVWTVSEGGVVRLWDARTGQPRGEPTTLPDRGDRVHAVALRSDDQRMLIGGSNRVVRQWDTETWKEVGPSLPHAGAITRILYTPDERLIATSGYDGSGRLWHPATGKLVGPLLAHGDRLDGLAVSPDGLAVATGSYQGRDARVWSVPAPVTLPPDEVVGWVERLTGQTMDAAGVVRYLAPDEWQSRGSRFTGPVPDLLPPLPFRPTRTDSQAPAMFVQLEGPTEREADQAVAPQRVTLKLDNAPLSAAVAALARESGLPLQLGNADDVRVSLDFKNVPAWQALDELRRRANLTTALTNTSVVLNAGKGVSSDVIAYPGPFRMQVGFIQRARFRAFGDQPLPSPSDSVLGVALNLTTAPHAMITGIGQPRCKSVLTDTGENLLPLVPIESYIQPLGSLTAQSGRYFTLQAPKKPAAKVSLSGTLPVELELNRRTRTEVASPRGQLRRLIALEGGGHLAIDAVQFFPGGSTASFHIVPPDGVSTTASNWRLELIEPDGRTTRAILTTGGNTYRVPFRPQDALWFAAPDAVPWSALALRSRGGPRPMSMTGSFQTPVAPSDKVRLRLSNVERKTVELPFAFDDLPLP